MEGEYIVFRRYSSEHPWMATNMVPYATLKRANDEVDSIHRYTTNRNVQTKIMILRNLEIQ